MRKRLRRISSRFSGSLTRYYKHRSSGREKYTKFLFKDGNGYISTSEIKFVLTRLGINLSQDDLQEMVIEADINGDSMITFEEFRDIFFEG